MADSVEEDDFMDESNETITNVAEYIRQDCAAKGPGVKIEKYEKERGDEFPKTVDVLRVTTTYGGGVDGFEIDITDPDDPQNIYLVEAEQRLKTLRQDILRSESEAP